METVHPGVGLDTRDFALFARALRKAAPELRAHRLLRLRAVGEIVASEARSRAAEASTTVPDSIKVRISGATVTVQAGGKGVPMGGLLELGNVGGRSTATFRHPVFGNRSVWVQQPMHPYLAPSLKAKFNEVEVAAVEALDATIAEAIR